MIQQGSSSSCKPALINPTNLKKKKRGKKHLKSQASTLCLQAQSQIEQENLQTQQGIIKEILQSNELKDNNKGNEIKAGGEVLQDDKQLHVEIHTSKKEEKQEEERMVEIQSKFDEGTQNQQIIPSLQQLENARKEEIVTYEKIEEHTTLESQILFQEKPSNIYSSETQELNSYSTPPKHFSYSQPAKLNQQIQSPSPFNVSSFSSTPVMWRHPSNYPQKETEEEIKEHRTEDRIKMLNKVLRVFKETMESYLDLGCGNCEISSRIASEYKVKKMICCDVYPEENLVIPEDLPSGINFQYISNINNSLSPVQDSSIDLITCFMVLHHIESIEANLSEIRRVTKEGGYLYIREHDVSPEDIFTEKYLRQKHLEFNDGGVLYMRFFSKKQLASLLSKFGFRHISDSLYNDSHPNRQHVYHSLFKKDSQIFEGSNSDASTGIEEEGEKQIASSNQDHQEENSKWENDSTLQRNTFARTLFNNHSKSPEGSQNPLFNFTLPSKSQFKKDFDIPQLVWRNSEKSTKESAKYKNYSEESKKVGFKNKNYRERQKETKKRSSEKEDINFEDEDSADLKNQKLSKMSTIKLKANQPQNLVQIVKQDNQKAKPVKICKPVPLIDILS